MPPWFFTNNIGKSMGIYKGLNCGLGSHDIKTHVLFNRNYAREAFAAKRLITLHQYHSSHIVHASDAAHQITMADGLVTENPHDMIAVLTAGLRPFFMYRS